MALVRADREIEDPCSPAGRGGQGACQSHQGEQAGPGRALRRRPDDCPARPGPGPQDPGARRPPWTTERGATALRGTRDWGPLANGGCFGETRPDRGGRAETIRPATAAASGGE